MERLSLAAAGGALAAIVVGSSNYAHAAPTTYEATCGASTLTVGTYSRDRDVSVAVYYNHGGWSIAHTLNNGHVYERNEQYDLIDTTSGSTLTWTGHLRRNPALVMTGWIETGSNGQPVYVEHLTKDGQVEFHSIANCTVNTPVQTPTPVAQTPTPVTQTPTPTSTAPTASTGSNWHTSASFETTYQMVVKDAIAQGDHPDKRCWPGYCSTFLNATYSDGRAVAIYTVYDNQAAERSFCVSTTDIDIRRCASSTGDIHDERHVNHIWETTQTVATNFDY